MTARSVFRRKRQLLRCLLDGEIGGEVAQTAFGLGGGHANFLLGGGHNAGAFLADRGLDALFVFQALLLHLGAEVAHLLIEAGELGLDGAQAGLGVRGGIARGLEIVAQGLGAFANDFGACRAERNGDREEDDGEVNSQENDRLWFRA